MKNALRTFAAVMLAAAALTGCSAGNTPTAEISSGSSDSSSGVSSPTLPPSSPFSSQDASGTPASSDGASASSAASGSTDRSSVSGSTAPSSASSASSASSLSNPDIRDGLRVYPIPEGTPTEESLFTVTANGQEVGMLSDKNGWGFPVSFGVFDMDNGYKVNIRIQVSDEFEISKATILPERLGLTASVKDNAVSFTVDEACNDITIVFDDLYIGPTLHLFVNPIDYEAPAKSSDDVLYFGPGYYNLKELMGGKLYLKSNQTLYVAGGAVIDGTTLIWNASNVKIRGSGILMKSDQASTGTGTENICLSFNTGYNVSVEGVVIHSHRAPNWTVHVYSSKSVRFDRVKIISTRYASTDALDITNSQDVTVTGCFLRACDDTITLKGLINNVPSACPPLENIHVSGSVLWNDCNNAMVLGEESRAKYYKNISFRDMDVLFSYDDKTHHLALDERSVMTICCLDGTYFSDVTWENIRVNRCERLLCFTFKDSYWFNTLKGDQSTPGGIDNILVKDVTVKTSSGSTIGNEILLNGWSDSKQITNVTFDNVVVTGKKVTAQYAKLNTNQYVGTLIFK